jgi:hypothetical protein
MSSTSDWQSRNVDGWQQEFWGGVGGEWLFGVAAHAVSTEYWMKLCNKTRNCIENQLYVKTVTSNPVLFRSTFSEIFCLWYNFVRSSHNALYSSTLSTDYSISQEHERKIVCQCDWKADMFDSCLKNRYTSEGQVVSTAGSIYCSHSCMFSALLCNAKMSKSADIASESSWTADIILRSTHPYSDVSMLLPLSPSVHSISWCTLCTVWSSPTELPDLNSSWEI